MKKKGFTLVELMVTVSVMMIMTSIVFFNYNRFNESTLLSSFAYDMSLTIRQAQVYGVATRQGSGSQSDPVTVDSAALNNFKSAYGVHFDKATTADFPLKLFADSPIGDGVYNLADDGVPLQSYSFQRGIKISNLCLTLTDGGAENCTYTKLDITFRRPDPEAIIKVGVDGGVAPLGNVSSARIELQNAGNSMNPRSIIVYPTGQISVK